VAVTTSVNDPREDFEVNALGTFNLLEGVRLSCPEAIVIYASTNKVYGDLKGLPIEESDEAYHFAVGQGVTEEQPLDFHSPYGCSKGAADQYVVDYSRLYGLRAVSLRQSCIYGPRQFGIEDQGWVAWFCIAAELGKPVTVYGNGKQSRDLLHVDDLVSAYRSIIRNADEAAGQVFNVGGGNDCVLSVNQLVGMLRSNLSNVSYGEERPGDQRIFISDNSKMLQATGWAPQIGVNPGVAALRQWIASERDMLIRFLT
jgi:CDP-paratose 2-epimerase